MIRTKTMLVVLALSVAATLALVVVAASRESGGPSARDAAGLRGSSLPGSLTRGQAPRIRLPAARGGIVDTADLRGRPYAVTFLYTACPDVCPLIGQELRLALARLGPTAGRVTVLGVSVDPAGDTPAAARDWLRHERLPSNFHYLIGSERELRPVWNSYFAAPQISGHPETSSHTASVWLVDGSGHRRTKYSAGGPVAPADLAHDLRVLAREAERKRRAT